MNRLRMWWMKLKKWYRNDDKLASCAEVVYIPNQYPPFCVRHRKYYGPWKWCNNANAIPFRFHDEEDAEKFAYNVNEMMNKYHGDDDDQA